MATVTVVDRNGISRRVDLQGADSLMLALRDEAGFEIAGECGGFCICGTCHVYIARSEQAALSPPSEEESELAAFLQHYGPDSRLACQIPLASVPAGLTIHIAPEE